jgi:hypothetical protein
LVMLSLLPLVAFESEFLFPTAVSDQSNFNDQVISLNLFSGHSANLLPANREATAGHLLFNNGNTAARIANVTRSSKPKNVHIRACFTGFMRWGIVRKLQTWWIPLRAPWKHL